MAKKSTKKGKSTSKRKSKKHTNLLPFFLALIVIATGGAGYYGWKNFSEDDSTIQTQEIPPICKNTNQNYGKAVDSCARIFNISPAYLKSLICLECSGKTGNLKRYERHVFKRLKAVRDGKSESYEGITKSMIADANDDALKNLATSWGPFQIMGYKCLHLDIHVADLRGTNTVYWSVKWIAEEYGHLLHSGRYKDAFHYHNTGRTFPANGIPTTYDKEYVPNGLHYMQFF